MNNMPLVERSRMTTPGVVSDSPTASVWSRIRGISPLLNNVLIDGADDNQALLLGRARTHPRGLLDPSQSRRFVSSPVNSGVYSAEYGRAAGGVINSVTKSGTATNSTVPAYFFDRQSSMERLQQLRDHHHGLDVLRNQSHPHRLHQGSLMKPKDSAQASTGFSVGGPIIKDKLFFWQYTYDQHLAYLPWHRHSELSARQLLLPA